VTSIRCAGVGVFAGVGVADGVPVSRPGVELGAGVVVALDGPQAEKTKAASKVRQAMWIYRGVSIF
ncbi:MAG: hypothetical protein Q8N45_13350, partial [Anaerolineales bacterium]|nr:hypothetical protein [Anaerolineales bacterium]